jgi:hypothetical protein
MFSARLASWSTGATDATASTHNALSGATSAGRHLQRAGQSLPTVRFAEPLPPEVHGLPALRDAYPNTATARSHPPEVGFLPTVESRAPGAPRLGQGRSPFSAHRVTAARVAGRRHPGRSASLSSWLRALSLRPSCDRNRLRRPQISLVRRSRRAGSRFQSGLPVHSLISRRVLRRQKSLVRIQPGVFPAFDPRIVPSARTVSPPPSRGPGRFTTSRGQFRPFRPSLTRLEPHRRPSGY